MKNRDRIKDGTPLQQEEYIIRHHGLDPDRLTPLQAAAVQRLLSARKSENGRKK